MQDKLIKKIILMVGIIAVLGVASSSVVLSSPASAQTSLSVANSDQSNSNEFVPGQIVVGLKKPDPNFHANVAALGGQVINTINEINAFVVKVPQNAENGFISAMSKNPNVKYAERDAIVTALFPNDQYYGIQWGMPRIGMDSVWANVNDRELGSGVIVAVVDTGIYDNHDDLDGARILTDIDWDFVDDDDDTRPNKICRQFGQSSAEWHATFVAGIIGATKHNSIGVAGVGPVDILPVRTLNQCGSGFSSDVAAGILHAKNNGAHVINLSLGSSAASNSILDAVNLAYAADIILVAAAGNDGDESISYPAGFDNVISVSATTNIDELASYSQFGNTIELSAPGGSSGSCSTSGTPYIVSTGAIVSGRNVSLTYLCAIGTSFASPHVAGVAALLKAQYMSDSTVSNVDIRTHLQTTAEDLGVEDKDIKFGYGLVRADVAVSTPISGGSPPNNPPTANDDSQVTDEDIAKLITLEGTDVDGDAITLFTIASGPTSGSLGAIGDIICDVNTPSSCTADVTYTPDLNFNGADSFTFTVKDATLTSTAATVDINVIDINDDPAAVDDADTVLEGDMVTTTVLANDSDVDGTLVPSSVTVVGTPVNGMAVANADGTITYTHDVLGTTSGSYTYTVDDDDGAPSNIATVTITVGEPSAGVTVSLIDYSTHGGRDGSKHLDITIALLDDLGDPVSGASVSIDLFRDGSFVAQGTGTTETDGTVTFSLNNASSGCYTTTVTSVNAGLTWDNTTPANQFCK